MMVMFLYDTFLKVLIRIKLPIRYIHIISSTKTSYDAIPWEDAAHIICRIGNTNLDITKL